MVKLVLEKFMETKLLQIGYLAGRKNIMSKKPLNISEEAAVQMPMKTVASLIVIVALGTHGLFWYHRNVS